VISIEACQRGKQIVIAVSDDGRGIDVEKVKQKALERCLAVPEEIMRMSDEAAVNLIFMPGFSTAEVATEMSGRGVGMDVVRTNIARLNGYVEVASRKGAGTTFIISIPLTLAITETLMVRSGGRQYAIPLAPIERTIRISREDIKEIVGQRVTVIRDRLYPVYELSELLGGNGARLTDTGYALLVTIGDNQFCLAVDELLGREEVVIKNVRGLDSDSPCILGATVTGDGKVVLILDVASLSRGLCGFLKT
jgi:two-component system chemotaxis sensor kinase CheA